MITNNDAEPIRPENRGEVNPTQPVEKVDAAESKRFSNLMEEEAEATENDGAITPEELNRQIRENLFKRGFEKAIEKAREISKEMKEG